MNPARRRDGATLGLLALLAHACASQPGARAELFPPPVLREGPPSAVDPARAAELVARVQRYERETGEFSAAVGISARDADGRTEFTGRGAIAVRRSTGAMRMQVAGPGGVTVVDLLARDGAYWLRVAGRGWTRGTLDEAPRGGRFPAAAIARAFLGFDWSRARIEREAGALALATVREPGVQTRVTFEQREGVLRELQWFVADVERARVRFGEFVADAHGVRVPRVAVFWQAEPRASSTITIESRTLTPTLPEATFAPPALP